jgi:hypothetical protein
MKKVFAMLSLIFFPLLASATPHQHLEIVKPDSIIANQPALLKIYFMEDDKRVKNNAPVSIECATRRQKISGKADMKNGRADLTLTLPEGDFLCTTTVETIWDSCALRVTAPTVSK